MDDFEKSWRDKINSQKEVCESRRLIDLLADESQSELEFTKNLIELLKEEFGTEQSIDILLGAACHYPHSELAEIRKEYAGIGKLEAAHEMLQRKFDTFIESLLLEQKDIIAEIKKRHWGLAGRLEGNRIFAAKIPKSGYLKEYFQETDPEKRRLLYCHCPRIRQYHDRSEIDALYCYCGGGFYQDIWEYITGKEVKVKLLKSIIKGDDHCLFELLITENDI
ncbi:MAG: DUF6144 family protein [Candidatus Stygibacter australis]|nr:DUF6144 family protein [Candidatus Stygibacter australis]MDP8322368.1 DUF6144 family protein [Candidatus Stygibacter australis]